MVKADLWHEIHSRFRLKGNEEIHCQSHRDQRSNGPEDPPSETTGAL